MGTPTFLFFGYGAEYSLHPLFLYMTRMKDHCIEVDLLTHPNPITALKELRGQEIVLITSAHLLYDYNNFSFYRTDREIVSVLHLISTLKPTVSVFYPHDYQDPIKIEEFSYLPLFDLLLWPFLNPDQRLKNLVKTKVVGWIKDVPNSDKRITKIRDHGRWVFFLGAYQYYLNAGFEKFFLDFSSLLSTGIAVKLPRWHENDLFEIDLAHRGVKVYPSDANSISIMRENDVIVTHALSSVTREACDLGKHVIYISNSAFDYLDPKTQYQDAGNIAFVNDPATAVFLKDRPLPPNRETMLQFNFEAARTAIWEEWGLKVK